MIRTETVFKRKTGETIVLIQIADKDIFTQQIEIDTFAKIIFNNETKYVYPNNSFDKSLNGLSVDEYISHGRKGLVSVLKPNELIKARVHILSMFSQ